MNNCLKPILFAWLLLWAAVVVQCQPRGKIEYYSTAQGLSHQRVTNILKDKEGFMWFGSWDGINRFDGKEFVSYKSSPGDSSRLRNDRIDQITEDQLGYLWILAYDHEVYRFNKQTEDFYPLRNLPSAKARGNIQFSRIQGAREGWVWLQSVNEGVFCVRQKDPDKSPFIQYKKGGAAGFGIPSNTVNYFYNDKKGRIWLGTSEGLCMLKANADGEFRVGKTLGAGKNFTEFDTEGDNLVFTTLDGFLIIHNVKTDTELIKKVADSGLNSILISRNGENMYTTTQKGELICMGMDGTVGKTYKYPGREPIHSVYQDRQGILWIEPDKAGVIRCDPQTGAFRHYREEIGDNFNALGNRFRVFEDLNGLLWVNFKMGSFGYFNPGKQEFEHLLNTPDASLQKLPHIVYSIYYDKAGLIWLTTLERELVKIILQGNHFTQKYISREGSSIAENEVRATLFDKQNRLWTATKDGKVQIFAGEKKIENLLENEPASRFGLVYTMLEDAKGNIWLGTKGNGLFKAVPLNEEHSRYRLQHFLPDKNNPNALPCNHIYSLLEEKEGRIWIGSFDNGLCLVLDSDTATRFVNRGGVFEAYPKVGFNRVRQLAMDGNQHIWAGTTDGLVIIRNNVNSGEAPFIKTCSKIPGDTRSLGNNDIQFIFRDSKSRMWLGTSGGGFSQAIGNDPFNKLEFRSYTTAEGMPNDYVLSCTEDADGKIWIATENGLSRFSPETQQFRNYDAYDGLPKAGFSEGTVSKSLLGNQLVFGTIKGYIIFNPARLENNRVKSNISFTHLYINNDEAKTISGNNLLLQNINYLDRISLKHNQNIISIDYALLDYRAGNRQSFAYRLIGFDTTWQDDRRQRRATYTNLPPGHYTFEVKSTNPDLYENAPFKKIEITIFPPPWKTWWAYLIYLVLLAALLFVIRKYVLAMIGLRNRIAIEQKLTALKLNFFTNVSHELRTPLTLIINPLEQLARKEKLSTTGASLVDVAQKNAGRMVRFINQLLDLRKIQSEKATLNISRIEVVSFVDRVLEHFSEAARTKRIRLLVEAPQEPLFAWLDAEKLDVIIYNLLSNAIKFTPDGLEVKVLIESPQGGESFSISVQDQGPGVEKGKLGKIFELFSSGDHGSADRNLKGIGIGLALTKEFVELQQGSINAQNNEDGGLMVTVQFKTGRQHFQQQGVQFVDAPTMLPGYETPVEQKILPKKTYLPGVLASDAPLVLLVEDNDELRNFITGQLSEFYRVETAKDGLEGLEKAKTSQPDLVVSDIMMPRMDGIQMLDKLKNDLDTSHIPVVLLSARYSIESQIVGLNYGADYYITKPFNSDFLIASIENLLRQRKRLFEGMVQKEKPLNMGPGPIAITSKDETFLKEVIRVVEQNMAETEFNIDSVAESLAMSRTTFYKKFKSLAGLAPVEFVRDMRLQRARQYLETGNNNVSEVAYLVGFSNPKYFSTCFREKYHVSPSEFQKSVSEN